MAMVMRLYGNYSHVNSWSSKRPKPAGQSLQMKLRPEGARMHQLVMQHGNYCSLFLQPKPPWSFSALVLGTLASVNCSMLCLDTLCLSDQVPTVQAIRSPVIFASHTVDMLPSRWHQGHLHCHGRWPPPHMYLSLLLLRWLLEQEELSIGFQLQQCIILVDWYLHNHRMLLRLDNMALMSSWRLIPTGKLCRNCKFAHSAIDRPTCFFPIQSVALKKMELWWFTIALLTEIVRMCTTGISRQLDVARSVHPTLLFTPAYQLCILAPTMFGFAWGSVDCISTSGTTSCALQITSSELRWFHVAFVGRQGLFQGGRHMPVYRHKELQLSWDPGGVAATCGQGSIGVITVATFFAQGFAGHKYYRSFDQIRASDNYYPGDSFD